MSGGFLTAEASLQSDSMTMQAKRPQATLMLKFGATAVELAVASNYVLNEYWTLSTSAASLKRFGKFNIASLAGLSLNVMTVWLLAGLGLYFLVANLFGIAAGVASNYVLSTTWVWGRL
jgi:putative flippase GtrA